MRTTPKRAYLLSRIETLSKDVEMTISETIDFVILHPECFTFHPEDRELWIFCQSLAMSNWLRKVVTFRHGRIEYEH